LWRVEPIPESADALSRLGAYAEGSDLRAVLAGAVAAAAVVIPRCVGVSVTLYDDGVPFTITCAPPETAEVDAAQYLDGGPCVETASGGEEQHVPDLDLMDEDVWQEYAAMASTHGIRSSLSLPIGRDGTISGAVNFYSAEPDAFAGRDEALARLFGIRVEDAVRNADLSFHTLHQARQLPETLDERATVAQAVGVHMARHGTDVDTAGAQLARAAELAGIPLVQLAQAVISSRGP